MSNQRFFTRDKLSKIGLFLASACVILNLINFCFNTFVYGITTTGILNYAINIIFYIIIAMNFNKAKGNFYFAYVAILMLIISDYVFPAIIDLISVISSSIINMQIDFYILSVSTILGIIYFILLCLENKKRSSGYLVGLIVVGSIMFVLGLVSFILTTISGVQGIIAIISAGSFTVNVFVQIFMFIVKMLISLTSIGFTVIYFMYPIIMKKTW
jgi:hypothetical protein